MLFQFFYISGDEKMHKFHFPYETQPQSLWLEDGEPVSTSIPSLMVKEYNWEDSINYMCFMVH